VAARSLLLRPMLAKLIAQPGPRGGQSRRLIWPGADHGLRVETSIATIAAPFLQFPDSPPRQATTPGLNELPFHSRTIEILARNAPDSARIAGRLILGRGRTASGPMDPLALAAGQPPTWHGEDCAALSAVTGDHEVACDR